MPRLSVAFLCSLTLVLGACASGSTRPLVDPVASATALERWNTCFEHNLDKLQQPHHDYAPVISEGIVACSGYQKDLVTLYPWQQQAEVHRQLTQRAINMGLQRIRSLNSRMNQVEAGMTRKSIQENLSDSPLLQWEMMP